MKKTIKVLLLLLFSLNVHAQENNHSIKTDVTSERLCKLMNIVNDSITANDFSNLFLKKVNTNQLAIAFGDRNTYSEQIFIMLHADFTNKLKLYVTSIRMSGTDFIDLSIKANFEKELTASILSLDHLMDEQKAKKLHCVNFVYEMSVRHCR